MVCSSRSTVTGSSGVCSSVAMISAASASVTIAVSSPFCIALPEKMSPNDGAITQRMP